MEIRGSMGMHRWHTEFHKVKTVEPFHIGMKMLSFLLIL